MAGGVAGGAPGGCSVDVVLVGAPGSSESS